MRRTHPCRAVVSGFTLIETLIVVVTLGIAAATVVKLTGVMFAGQANNPVVIAGTQVMEQCAEHVLALKRSGGYSSITSSSCSGVAGLTAPDSLRLFCGTPPSGAALSCTTCGTACTVEVRVSGLQPLTLRLVK